MATLAFLRARAVVADTRYFCNSRPERVAVSETAVSECLRPMLFRSEKITSLKLAIIYQELAEDDI